MKATQQILIIIAAALCVGIALHAGDLLPPAPAQRTHVQDVADQVKADSKTFVETVARRVEANISACWADPQHTPQEFLDQFGTKAGASLQLNGQAAALVIAYEQSTGLTILDRAILAKAGNYTVNQDGTVTVN